MDKYGGGLLGFEEPLSRCYREGMYKCIPWAFSAGWGVEGTARGAVGETLDICQKIGTLILKYSPRRTGK